MNSDLARMICIQQRSGYTQKERREIKNTEVDGLKT